ncbi:hypothetical protein ACP70R_011629 [Stipagrostis hirtigluma subsp. patula]
MMAQPSSVRASSTVPSTSEDRLSSLPDALLHTIMSFLKARQAVQTCVLSRRWVDLWCTMPCLDIDQRELEGDAAGSCDHGTYESGRFERFVNILMMFYKAPTVDTFRFHITRFNNYYHNSIHPWLRRGIKCCPAVLEISYPYSSYPSCELPHLGSSSCRLKRMRLFAIYLDKNFTLQLCSGCPVLEDLELDDCFVAYPEIKSCTLKNLVINDCKTHEGNVLTVATRALVSLHLVITSFEGHGIIVNEMPSLVKASVCLKYHRCASTLREGTCKLLGGLINVRNLKISGSDTLITLLFDGCDLSDNFQILAPTFEKLTLQYCKLAEGSKKRKRREYVKKTSLKPQSILTFECPDLKWTEIKYKAGDVHKLFDLLSGIWANLQESRITLTKT